MPNKLLWDAEPTSPVTVVDPGSTLAADTLSSFDSTNKYDNGANLNRWGWLALATSSGNLCASAITRVSASAIIYMARMPAGTIENVPVTADRLEFGQLRVGQIPLATETGIVTAMMAMPILLPPFELQFAVFNNSDQTWQNTWQLDLYVANEELQ